MQRSTQWLERPLLWRHGACRGKRGAALPAAQPRRWPDELERDRAVNETWPAWAREALRHLEASWSHKTSSSWSSETPSCGQCGVTALVIQDAFGGEILKTRVEAGWHFYNRISELRLDFTASQFSQPIQYDDVPSSRAEAFRDTDDSQYAALAQQFRAAREAAGRNRLCD